HEASRWSINITTAGIGGLVDHYVNEGSKLLGGRLSYLSATLRASLRYRNVPVSVYVDDWPIYEGPSYIVGACNGMYCGGGMMLAPTAHPADGLLDVVVVGDLDLLETIMLSPHICKGRHVEHPKVKTARGKSLRMEFHSDQCYIDLDGEYVGVKPSQITLHSGCLRFAGQHSLAS